MKKVYVFTGLAVSLFLSGCASQDEKYHVAGEPAVTESATIYCVQEGGTISFANANGERQTFCDHDNNHVEQWAYYNQHH
ncbi:DUF333 domain-containing protein [Vibrio marisflavi]|uniref:Hemolysin n=1 Tax=Vibrio marisflavi CECT 7928 TaxID=634439 RepID=A0ABM9A0H4_9VIBR|nr:DUF333 domain-containing protein [Vibrio marisflavi]CAH0536967.1 hypothetical protein VMF7928_00840 [Vibrio marisflavi CECT 7928]